MNESVIIQKLIQVGQMLERGELEYSSAEADIKHYLEQYTAFRQTDVIQMIKEEDYLKAKQIVQEYEKQLNISDVSGSVFKFVIHKPSGKIGYYNEKTNRFRENNNYFDVTPKIAINCDSFEVHYHLK